MTQMARAAVFLALLSCSFAEEPPLTPVHFAVPGVEATPWLRYADPLAQRVDVAGTWDRWESRKPLILSNGVWTVDSRTLHARPGRHEYKFLPDGKWESGDNRVLFINDEGLLERPPDVISAAVLDTPNEVVVYLKRKITPSANLAVHLEPAVAVTSVQVAASAPDNTGRGYAIAGNAITFTLDESIYNLNLGPATRVAVAGNFNHWDGGGGSQGQWLLKDADNDNVWEMTTALSVLRPPPGEKELIFKFVINSDRWLAPPSQAANAVNDGKGNVNLRVEPNVSGNSALKIITAEPLKLSENYSVVIDGLAPRRARFAVSPGRILDTIVSSRPLGALVDHAQNATTYRIFAPRARSVHLCIFSTPEFERRAKPGAEAEKIQPLERYAMWRYPDDGVWEISLAGIDAGKYYSFNVDGPSGEGESFFADAQVGDPYALAAAHSHNNAIVIDPAATTAWFSGWTDQAWKTPPLEEQVIYETHVRNFSKHPSSLVPDHLRGTYAGFIATEGRGTGLDHLKQIGVNMIELMPICEFENGEWDYGWGYSPVYYFSPEASYAMEPNKGSQYYEFKNLVNELHRRGFGVILDVVYNHVGSPNLFALIDRKYFFRLTHDLKMQNFSGCGNDIRSEAPMMRRLIVDNVVYWMKEHHVDGFRFDLGELIDMETMLAVRDAAVAINPNVALISEPWSFRGENKKDLKGTGWSAWNNDMRYAAKDFVLGRGDRDWLRKAIAGSTEVWSSSPLQSVPYVESHDDMALADELSQRPDRNGSFLEPRDARRNTLAATIVFTSLGVPMISEGQEFLRSKQGIHNTYDRGDKINALQWTDRDRPLAAEALAYYTGLIQLRRSPQGASFRVRELPSQDYYQWITPPDRRVLGYIVNARHEHAGNGFVVLLNGSDEAQTVSFPLPAGNWRVIGNGSAINLQGIPDTVGLAGPVQHSHVVPPHGAIILMDGF
jgi:pullulanase